MKTSTLVPVNPRFHEIAADMAKKKPPTETVRINSELAKKIRIVAAAKDISVPDYISERFGPLVEKDLSSVAKSLNKDSEN